MSSDSINKKHRHKKSKLNFEIIRILSDSETGEPSLLILKNGNLQWTGTVMEFTREFVESIDLKNIDLDEF